MDLHHVIQRPLVTEKSAIAREEANIATFRVDPTADPDHQLRQWVAKVQQWKTRLTEEGRTEDVEAARRELVRGMERDLERNPRQARLRRALARVHRRAEPPRRDLAAEVLGGGLDLALPDRERASLLNDLAVLTLDTDAERASKYLAEAINLDPSALRYQNWADVAWHLRRFDDAARGYAQAFELDPTSTESRDRWAAATARRGAAGRDDGRRQLETWVRNGRVDRESAARLYELLAGEGGSAP